MTVAKLTQPAHSNGVQVNPSDIFSLMGVYPGFPQVPGVPGFDGEAAIVGTKHFLCCY
jgi:hypothetical protein